MLIKFFHDKVVYSRRMERLTVLIEEMIRGGENILDIGCGDGRIDFDLMQRNKEIDIKGLDVLIRAKTYIKVKKYDGYHIPMASNSVDMIMLIDVLHHVDDPKRLMKELVRVSTSWIIIKDHIRSGICSYLKLRLMDYVGNAHYHVRLPYNYMTREQWKQLFEENGLYIEEYKEDLHLYSGIFHWLFDRKLHFIVKLHVKKIC